MLVTGTTSPSTNALAHCFTYGKRSSQFHTSDVCKRLNHLYLWLWLWLVVLSSCAGVDGWRHWEWGFPLCVVGAVLGQRLAGCTHCQVWLWLQGVAGESTGTAAAQSSSLAFVWGTKWDLAANRADLCSQQKLAMKAAAPRKQTQI